MSDDTSKLLKACVEYRAMVAKLEAENAALRAELGWKTKRIKLLSDSLHDIEGVLKKAATSIFLDAFEAEPKEAQP